jgi:hypothetical protein
MRRRERPEGRAQQRQRDEDGCQHRGALRGRHREECARAPSSPASIFDGSLPIVAALRERLPIGAIPEQHHVATVRLDVIDDAGGGCIGMRTMELALAQRMIDEEAQRLTPPFARVAAL